MLRDGDEVATGRLILLHDPAGHEAWQGTLRLVTYVTAELEADLAADPLLPGVGWTLADRRAGRRTTPSYRAIGGTVTQTISTRFGDLAGPPTAGDIEIRASWTPLDDDLSRPPARPGARCSPRPPACRRPASPRSPSAARPARLTGPRQDRGT